MDLPGYDAWKLASPPEYDAPDTCPRCESQDGFYGNHCDCGWSAEGEEDAYLDHVDRLIDEARDREAGAQANG